MCPGLTLLPFDHPSSVSWARGGRFMISALLSVFCGHAGTGARAQGVAWPSFFPAVCASLMG